MSEQAGTSGGRLAGKVALITGAGSGMGFAMTKLFAQQGARIAAIARSDSALATLAAIDNVEPIRADVTVRADIDRMFDTAESKLGPVDIVCNAAGIHDGLHPLHATDDELWDKLINTDLRAPFQICRRAIDSMVERKSGAILNISSIAAYLGLHGPSYGAAKAGMIGMSKSIAVRYFEHGVRCNVICPGSTRTEISNKSGELFHDGRQFIKEVAGRDLQRWAGNAQDIAETALFLCSDEARHVNGVVLPVDGGMSSC